MHNIHFTMHSPAFLHLFAAAGVTWMNELPSADSKTGTRRFEMDGRGGCDFILEPNGCGRGRLTNLKEFVNYFVRLEVGTWNGPCVMIMQDFFNKNV